MARWKGSDVMYFGDSLWADLVDAAQIHGWYTGAIIHELRHELDSVNSERYTRLAFANTVLEELLRSVQVSFRNVTDFSPRCRSTVTNTVPRAAFQLGTVHGVIYIESSDPAWQLPPPA